MRSGQYKLTHDEAFIISAALDDWDFRDYTRSLDEVRRIQASSAIHELTERMKNQGIDGRRSGRRSVVSLTDSLKRLHLHYQNKRW